MSVENTSVRVAIARREEQDFEDQVGRVSSVQHSNCLVGAYCGHAVLTVKIGVYRCPFGACFKKLENQKRGAS